ncbi:MAG: LuxR C-terminal-related transcriptional regulator [Coriobacteriia bacterium]|nr:LuxR C-terminal-related transcriptional regulator [Coriobacteriia bacterium]
MHSISKINVSSYGYGLFLALNATSVWGGVFPFLPSSVQTEDYIFWFFLAQSISFAATFIVMILFALKTNKELTHLIFKVACLTYFSGYLALIATMYLAELSFVLALLGGTFLGIGSAIFYCLWQLVFAGEKDDKGPYNLIVGTALAALFYAGLYALPRVLTTYLIPLIFLPLFALAYVLSLREIDDQQPMYQDRASEYKHIYKKTTSDLWRSALSIAALGLCTGIMRALSISDVSIGAWINILSMGALFSAAIALLLIWQTQNFKLNVLTIYRIIFPFVISGLLVLPFLPIWYERFLAISLYALHSIAIILMMIQAMQLSKNRGVHPMFTFAVFSGVVFSFHDVGFIAGRLSGIVGTGRMNLLLIVSLVTIYLLSLMYMFGYHGFSRALRSSLGAEKIEFIALRAPDPNEEAKYQAQLESKLSDKDSEGKLVDRVSKQVAKLQNHYRLTERESEIAELIVRGYTVSAIAEKLYISENTVRSHSKHIYTKLDIHKKQELISLAEAMEV